MYLRQIFKWAIDSIVSPRLKSHVGSCLLHQTKSHRMPRPRMTLGLAAPTVQALALHLSTLLLCDVAAVCTECVLCLLAVSGRLEMGHVYSPLSHENITVSSVNTAQAHYI